MAHTMIPYREYLIFTSTKKEIIEASLHYKIIKIPAQRPGIK